MKIRITQGGIFGKDGEIPVGTELTVRDEPKGWGGRYDIIGDDAGKEPVTNDEPPDLDAMTDDEVRSRYEDVMGEKPHHAAGRDTMIARIKAKQAE